MAATAYPLEQLYADQDADWVIDTIPAVLAWVPGRSQKRASQPFTFEIEHIVAGQPAANTSLSLSWDIAALEKYDREVRSRARRMREARTAQREHIAELAAYGLALVSISLLMPGRRIVLMRRSLPPDLVFDITPNCVRGVEVAGRAQGGVAALSRVRDGSGGSPGKAAKLLERPDIAEVHLSLWCASPRVAIMQQIKP
jgi:hypothetical protein